MLYQNFLLEQALGALENSVPGEGRLRGKLMVDLHKTKKPLVVALESYMEAKQAVLEEYGTQTPEGFSVEAFIEVEDDDKKNVIENPKWKDFADEFNELSNAETNFEPTKLPIHLLDLLEFTTQGWSALVGVGIVEETTGPQLVEDEVKEE